MTAYFSMKNTAIVTHADATNLTNSASSTLCIPKYNDIMCWFRDEISPEFFQIKFFFFL